MITDEDRAKVCRELAEALPDWEGMGMLEQWLLQQADALDGPQAVWERSLPLGEEPGLCNEHWMEDALQHLRYALINERSGRFRDMLRHSQMAAARIVARRRSLGEDSEPVRWSVGGERRACLREAVRLLMRADEGSRETLMLRRIEDLLRTIWEQKVSACDTFWGSHGCDLPGGHDGHHECRVPILDEDGDTGTYRQCSQADGARMRFADDSEEGWGAWTETEVEDRGRGA